MPSVALVSPLATKQMVWLATPVGFVMVAVGVLAGLDMAWQERLVTCPEGTHFPEGTTDLDCYVRPQLELGLAIAAMSIVLGILLAFSSALLKAHLEAGRPPG